MYDTGMMALLAYYTGLAIFLFIVFLVFYVLKSIGIMTLASNKGIENAWLAWIPVADLYIAGSILGEMDLFGNRLDNLSLWLPVIMLAGVVLGQIPFLGFLIGLASMVFFLIFAYNLFNLYSPNQAALYTILSIIGLWPVFIFIIRNNQAVSDHNLTA